MYLPSILVVEDNDSIRYTLQVLLEGEGYRVISAENGKVAIDLLRSLDRPALIILDMMMPVMSGWEFLEVRKRELGLGDIPVIAVSAAMAETSGAHAAGRPAGVSEFLAKPFEVDSLIQLVRKYARTGF